MAELLSVPEVAAGATEVVLSEWLIEPGAAVRAGDPIAVVETEKAVVEIEAEADTVVARLLAEPGASVEVGSPMAILGTADEANADPDELAAALGLRPSGDGEEASVPETSARTEVKRLFISPLARRLLREAGIEPEDVTGSGPNGRIVRRDVERAIAQRAIAQRANAQRAIAQPASEPAETLTTVQPAETVSAPAAPAEQPTSGGGGYVEVEHSRLRRAVATRLGRSKREVPHFYLRRTARLDRLMRLRDQVNHQSSTRVSVNDFVIRAVAVAHQTVPDANVIWTDEAMRRFDSVDVGVAIASERGLVTPVLRSVETMSISAVSAQVKSFVEQANVGRLRQRDLEGGSISVTNLGMYGVDEFAAIINPPQSAILAVGAARPTPIVADSPEGAKVEVATVVQLTLSVDHRAIDGTLAAKWMGALVDGLENPLRLLV